MFDLNYLIAYQMEEILSKTIAYENFKYFNLSYLTEYNYVYYILNF